MSSSSSSSSDYYNDGLDEMEENDDYEEENEDEDESDDDYYDRVNYSDEMDEDGNNTDNNSHDMLLARFHGGSNAASIGYPPIGNHKSVVVKFDVKSNTFFYQWCIRGAANYLEENVVATSVHDYEHDYTLLPNSYHVENHPECIFKIGLKVIQASNEKYYISVELKQSSGRILRACVRTSVGNFGTEICDVDRWWKNQSVFFTSFNRTDITPYVNFKSYHFFINCYVRFYGYLDDLNLDDVIKIDSTDGDVQIIIDNKRLWAHKKLLTECSPVFDTMFSIDMIEKAENTVTITDIDVNAMAKVLNFLYSNEIIVPKCIDDDLISLLSIAEKYQIDKLQKVCQNSLLSELSVNNVFRMFEISQLFHMPKFHEIVIDYIFENHYQIIHLTDYFNFYQQNPKVMTEIIKRITNANSNYSCSGLYW